jgi:DNA-binding NarL/FixJ family response regulator
VCQLLLSGASNAEIARLRRTSVRTVANQVAAILKKLGAGSRTELPMILARQNPTLGGAH